MLSPHRHHSFTHTRRRFLTWPTQPTRPRDLQYNPRPTPTPRHAQSVWCPCCALPWREPAPISTCFSSSSLLLSFFLLHLSPSRHSYTNFDTSTLISHGFQELEEIDPRLQAGEEGVRRLVANALSSYYRRVGF
jgi:hypothetical protein